MEKKDITSENIINKKECENKYEFIPCEICDELVVFSEYNQHIQQRCNRNRNTSDLIQIINDMRNITNSLRDSNVRFQNTMSESIRRHSSSMLSDNNDNSNTRPPYIYSNYTTNSNNNNNIAENNDNSDNNDNIDNNENSDDNSDTNSNNSSTSSVDEVATNQFFSNPSYIMPPLVRSPALHNIFSQLSNSTAENFAEDEDNVNTSQNNVQNNAINRYNTLVQLLPSTHFDNSAGTYDYLRNLTSELGDVKVGVKDLSKLSTIHLYSSELRNECIICREDKTRFLEMIDCKHSFCSECCNHWFSENKKCPICQKEYE